MSENKNIRNKLAEFFRYIRNELSGKERNSFERELQKDPFADEALEGFSSLTESEAEEDIAEINERIRKRTGRKSKTLVYRIAVIVTLIVTISVVLVVNVVKKPENQLALNTKEPKSFEILENKPIIASDSKDNNVSEQAREEKKSFTASDQNATKGFARSTDSVEKRGEVTSDMIAAESKAAPSKEEVSRKPVVSAPMAALARRKEADGYTVSGRVVSIADNMPIPGANVLIKGTTKGAITDLNGNFSLTLPDSSHNTIVAGFIGMESKEVSTKPDSQLQIGLNSSVSSLSEVVVTGYSAKKSDAGETDDISEYLHPEPVNGKSEFDRYMKNNLRRPANSDPNRKAIVVLSFLIRTNGQIDSIRIVKSPGKEYSDEAIRVIKSGPAWKPAQDNGKSIEEDVRLRIVFR